MMISDTIVAQATAVGDGAIGIVRLSGAQAKGILTQAFKGTTSVDEFVSHQLYLGFITDETQQPLDQVLAVWMQGPHTYTGEDMVEIHAHGGRFVLCRVIDRLLSLGARLAEPGEFTKRAYLNGKLDLSQAEAVADLIAAQNDWSAQNALKQLDGALAQLVTGLTQKLNSILAELEAGFDFSEEDIQFVKRDQVVALLSGVENTLGQLLDSFQTGKIYKEGLRIALVGRPNVGKSSLLNALLKEQRAIIHSEAGTTRDVIEGERKYEGVVMRFYDTAGLRKAEHDVEKQGIVRSQEVMDRADIVLVVCDGSATLEKEDHELLEQLKGKKAVLVRNKSDLEAAHWRFPTHLDHPHQAVSAKTQQGLSELLQTIYDIAIGQGAQKDHNYVLNNVRHQKIVKDVFMQIQQVTKNLQSSSLTEECLVEELRIIIKKLTGIIDPIDTETVLDEVFSKFCVGK